MKSETDVIDFFRELQIKHEWDDGYVNEKFKNLKLYIVEKFYDNKGKNLDLILITFSLKSVKFYC